ncbi:MAG: TetR/AcrR family transcriptional regulator [Spirochaetes bacterium]|nr:TetR/AcrR family transcriptional regulator [Spirochaetota bacterium]
MKIKNTMSQLKTREREERKNLIIDAAEQVFSAKPFNKVSMREIAVEAGIAPSSLYTYFPNQELLFVEATVRDSNRLIDEMEKMLDNADQPDQGLKRVIEAFIDFISSHDSYFRMMVIFMTVGSLNPESFEKLNDVVRRGFAVFETVFKKMGYEGNSRILAHYFFAMLNGILVTFRKLEGRSDEVIIAHMKRVANVFSELLVQSTGRNQP